GGAKSGPIIQGMDDRFTSARDIRAGAPTLFCAVGDATGTDPTFRAFQDITDAKQILCYEEQAPSSDAAGTVVTVRDPLSPQGIQALKLGTTKYVCVQAVRCSQFTDDEKLNLPPDCPPPAP